MTAENGTNGKFCKVHSGLVVRVDHLEEGISEMKKDQKALHGKLDEIKNRITWFFASVVVLIVVEIVKWGINYG